MFANVRYLTGVKSVEIGENSPENEGCCGQMFTNCANLENVGNVSMPRVLNVQRLFKDCQRLKRIGVINMPRVMNMEGMFMNDTALLSICQFFVPSTASGSRMFEGTQLGSRVYGVDGKTLFARMRLLGH